MIVPVTVRPRPMGGGCDFGLGYCGFGGRVARLRAVANIDRASRQCEIPN